MRMRSYDTSNPLIIADQVEQAARQAETRMHVWRLKDEGPYRANAHSYPEQPVFTADLAGWLEPRLVDLPSFLEYRLAPALDDDRAFAEGRDTMLAAVESVAPRFPSVVADALRSTVAGAGPATTAAQVLDRVAGRVRDVVGRDSALLPGYVRHLHDEFGRAQEENQAAWQASIDYWRSRNMPMIEAFERFTGAVGDSAVVAAAAEIERAKEATAPLWFRLRTVARGLSAATAHHAVDRYAVSLALRPLIHRLRADLDWPTEAKPPTYLGDRGFSVASAHRFLIDLQRVVSLSVANGVDALAHGRRNSAGSGVATSVQPRR